jgi:capsular exopolysaccharide synthesis family protein
MLLEDYGPDHPRVKALRKKMDLMREHLSGAEEGEVIEEKKDLLAVYLESLEQELKVGEEKLRELDMLFTTEREAAKTMASFQVADETYRGEISRTQALFNAVVKRLDEINLVSNNNYGGVTLQIISPPSGAWQVQPNLANNLLIGGILGMLAGCMLAYAVDRADRRFRSPEEIRRELGVPVLGHVPMITPTRRQLAAQRRDPSRAKIAPVLATLLQPESPAAEAYRGLRTTLLFSARRSDYRVVQVTSAHPGEGKTTLASNLAISLAQSGKKTLLVDADFRRPRIDTVLDLDDSCGLATVLSGQSELCDSVRTTAVEGLWALPCGPVPRNPAELLSSAEFAALVEVLREQYDFVIIDTAPLLPVSDPAIVASHADTVILVMRLTTGARDAAIQATEILAGLEAEVLGVVVNGVGSAKPYGGRRTRFRYGQYRYGVGSRYGYGYGPYHGGSDSRENGPPAQGEAAEAAANGERPTARRVSRAHR